MADETRDILLQIEGQNADARRALAEIAADVSAFDRVEGEATVRVNTAKARTDIGALEAKLKALSAQTADPDVRLRIVKFMTELRVARAELNRLGARRVTVDVRTRRGIINQLTRIGRTLDGMVRTVTPGTASLNKFGDALDSAGGSADGANQPVRGLGRTLKGLTPLLAGSAVLIGVSLVSALGALTASLGAAIGGLGALANAFLVTLGPAVALIVALFARLAAVFGAKQAQDQAAASSAKDAGEAAEDSAAAHEKEASAAERVRDAKQGLVTAQRNYVEAIKRARQTILEALRDEKDAVQNLKAVRQDAAQDLKAVSQDAAQGILDAQKVIDEARERVSEAAVAGLEAWQDAVQDLTDAHLNLRDAQLDILDAEDAVGDIEKKIKDLLSGEGVDPKQIEQAIKKLTDVDLVGFDFPSFMATLGIEEDADQAEKLSDLLRDLERAKLGVDKANNNLTKSEKNVADAQGEVNDFTAQGVLAYEPYTDAVKDLNAAQADLVQTQQQAGKAIADAEQQAGEAIANAKRKVADAHREVTKLQKDGIKTSSAVVSAAEQLRDAHESLATAMRKTGIASTAAGAEASQAFDTAQMKLAELSETEREFLELIREAGSVLRKVFQPATDAILGGLIVAFKKLLPLVRSLGPGFTALGTVWAALIVKAADALNSPAWKSGFETIMGGTISLSAIGGKAFGSFAELIRNLAVASMPSLVRAMRAVSRTFKSWADGTKDTSKLSKTIDMLVDNLGSWLRVIGQLTNLFAAFIGAAAPFGKLIVDQLAKGAENLAEWLRSDEGMQRVKEFFEDTLPFAKELSKFIGKMVLIFLQLFQILAPGLKDTFASFNLLLDVVGFLLEIMLKIPAPIRSIILQLVLLKKPIGVVGKLINGVKVGVAGLAGAVILAIGAIGGFINALGDVIPSLTELPEAALELGKDILAGIVDGITAVPELIAGAADWLWETYKAQVERTIGQYIAIGKWVLERVKDGFVAVAGVVKEAAVWLAQRVKQFVEARVNAYREVGRFVIKQLVNGIRTVISALSGFGGWLRNRVSDAVKTVGSGFAEIGRSALRALVGGLRTLIDQLGGFGGWIKNRIKDAVEAIAPKVRDIGLRLINFIIDGLLAFPKEVTKRIKQFADDIVQKVKDFLGIGSPSKVFLGIGENLATSLVSGMNGVDIGNFIKNKLGGFASLGAKMLGSGLIKFSPVGLGIEGLKKLGGVLGGGDGLQIPPPEGMPGPASRTPYGLATKYLDSLFVPLAKSLGLVMTNGLAPRANASFHPVNRARDLSDGVDTPAEMKFSKMMVQFFMRWIRELFFTPMGFSIKNLRRAGFTVPGHDDHLHLALAKGGLVGSDIIARLGEGRHKEAVLPLSTMVFRQLAESIVDQMRVMVKRPTPLGAPALSPATVGVPGAPTYHQTFNVPPAAPAATQPDPRITAAQIALELRMRGGV